MQEQLLEPKKLNNEEKVPGQPKELINNGKKYIYYDQKTLGQARKEVFVYLGEMKNGDVVERVAERVAIKITNKNNDNMNEIQANRIVQRLDSDFVMKIYDIFEDNENYYTINEYFPLGDLSNYIRDNPLDSIYKLQQRYLLSLQLLQGLIDLHRNGITHRDIKTTNIILKQDDISNIKAAICDFDTISDQSEMNKPLGSPSFVHPYVLYNKKLGLKYGKYVDIWSSIITIIRLCCNYIRRDENSNVSVQKALFIVQDIIGDRSKEIDKKWINFGDYEQLRGDEAILLKEDTLLHKCFVEANDEIKKKYENPKMSQQMLKLNLVLFNNLYKNLITEYKDGDTIRQIRTLQQYILNLYIQNCQDPQSCKDIFNKFIYDKYALIPLILHKYTYQGKVIVVSPLELELDLEGNTKILTLMSEKLFQNHRQYSVHHGKFQQHGGQQEDVLIQVIYPKNYDYRDIQIPITQKIGSLQHSKCILNVYKKEDYFILSEFIQENLVFKKPVYKDLNLIWIQIKACFFMINKVQQCMTNDLFMNINPSFLYYWKKYGEFWFADNVVLNIQEINKDNIRIDEYMQQSIIGGKVPTIYSQVYSLILSVIYIISRINLQQEFREEMETMHNYVKKDSDYGDLQFDMSQKIEEIIKEQFKFDQSIQKQVYYIVNFSLIHMFKVLKVEKEYSKAVDKSIQKQDVEKKYSKAVDKSMQKQDVLKEYSNQLFWYIVELLRQYNYTGDDDQIEKELLFVPDPALKVEIQSQQQKQQSQKKQTTQPQIDQNNPSQKENQSNEQKQLYEQCAQLEDKLKLLQEGNQLLFNQLNKILDNILVTKEQKEQDNIIHQGRQKNKEIHQHENINDQYQQLQQRHKELNQQLAQLQQINGIFFINMNQILDQ